MSIRTELQQKKILISKRYLKGKEGAVALWKEWIIEYWDGVEADPTRRLYGKGGD